MSRRLEPTPATDSTTIYLHPLARPPARPGLHTTHEPVRLDVDAGRQSPNAIEGHASKVLEEGFSRDGERNIQRDERTCARNTKGHEEHRSRKLEKQQIDARGIGVDE